MKNVVEYHPFNRIAVSEFNQLKTWISNTVSNTWNTFDLKILKIRYYTGVNGIQLDSNIFKMEAHSVITEIGIYFLISNFCKIYVPTD